jgi:hypothetical protein
MTLSTQNKELQVKYSTPLKKNPPDGKTTAVVAVIRGNSKHVTTTNAVAVTSTPKRRYHLDRGIRDTGG